MELDLSEIKGSLLIFDFLIIIELYQSAYIAVKRTYLKNFLKDYLKKEVLIISQFL